LREYPNFAGAKHDLRKSLLLTHKLFAGMLRPYGYICKNGMLPKLISRRKKEEEPPPAPPRGEIQEEDLCSQLFGHPYFTFN
jgi:hypothetical protein